MEVKPTKKQVAKISGIAAAIIAAVFAVEGGYVNDPRDPGGETNHGITQQVALTHGHTGPMKELTQEKAADIYYQDYIVKPGYHGLLLISPAVSEKLVDAAVNTGASRPSLWFQKALNALNRNGRDYPAIGADGKVGANTIKAYQALERVRGKVLACELVLKLIDAQQAMHYLSLEKQRIYTPGWIANRIGNVPLSKCREYPVQ